MTLVNMEKKIECGFKKYDFYRKSLSEMQEKATELETEILKRRSVRHFSDEAVPEELIRKVISIANSAPSGANKQPWFFAMVFDSDIKREIRIAAENEEYANYKKRMSKEWLKDLEPLGTKWEKPNLEIAPCLIVLFKKNYNLKSAEKSKNYYVAESVGIAAGFLISAIHQVGLVTLPHTPSPMDFLGKILERPKNEKAYLLFPVGFPAENAMVPDITKKSVDELSKKY